MNSDEPKTSTAAPNPASSDTSSGNGEPFRLLGHAINHIQDQMDAEFAEFSATVTKELAADDCFRTVLAGYLEQSGYRLAEHSANTDTVRLQFYQT